MGQERDSFRKPQIVMGQSDYRRLLDLADAVAESDPEVSDELAGELDRATVVADEAVEPEAVRMGSRVTYRTETGETRAVTLVFPGEADIARGRVSILTPVGTALLGLRPEQSIDWRTRNGRTHRLTVVAVSDGEAGAADHGQGA